MAQRRLQQFVQALRAADLRISPVEAGEAMQAASLSGYADRDVFRETLAIALVKQQADRPVFDACFEQFFYFETDDDSDDAQEGAEPGKESGERGSGAPDSASLEQALAQATAEMDFSSLRVITQQGLFARSLMMRMGVGAVDDEIIQLQASDAPQSRERLAVLQQWRTRAAVLARDHVQRQFALTGRAEGRALREDRLRRVAFFQASEYRQMHALVQRMARRLARLHGRRQQRAKRGALNARRTLAMSVRHDGVPVDLHWRRRRRDRSQIWVVCDVSGSVSQAARFLLLFLHAVSDVLPRVRSFAFASHFGDVTDDFARYDGAQAVARVLQRLSGSGTDYGHMLSRLDALSSQINPQTTVIILGDARNNYMQPRERHLAALARRARQVFWLNPENPAQWNSGDSVMARYQPYCRAALRCANLDDLDRFVSRLLREAVR